MAFANKTVKIDNVRFHWLRLFEPKKYTSDAGKVSRKFEATIIVEPDSEADKIVNAAIEDICREQFGEKSANVLKKLNQDGRNCYKDGNLKTNADGEIHDGFADMKFFRASRDDDKKGAPYVYNQYAQRITDETRDNFTGDFRAPRNGDYGAATINFWTLDATGEVGRRIVADLELVMVTDEGPPFASGGVTESSADDMAAKYAKKLPEAPAVPGMEK